MDEILHTPREESSAIRPPLAQLRGVDGDHVLRGAVDGIDHGGPGQRGNRDAAELRRGGLLCAGIRVENRYRVLPNGMGYAEILIRQMGITDEMIRKYREKFTHDGLGACL